MMPYAIPFLLLSRQYFKKVTFSCHFVVSFQLLFCIRGWTVPINLCAKTTTASGEEESTRFIIDLNSMWYIFIYACDFCYNTLSLQIKCVWFDYLIFQSFSIFFLLFPKNYYSTLCCLYIVHQARCQS